MVLTKELLEKRIEIMEAQRQQFLANANACGGAVTMLRQLLTDLESEEPEEASDAKDEGAGMDHPAPMREPDHAAD